MIKHPKKNGPGPKKYLAMAIPMIMSFQAQGFEFYSSGIEGSFDSELSIGSSWRMEKQNDSVSTPGNFEDGNANFDKGDAFSQVFKGSHALQASYKNFGGFVRGKYWYDSALSDNNVDYGHTSNATIGGAGATTPSAVNMNGESHLDDSEFNDAAKFSGAQLMDAYVYGEFDVLDMPLDVRLGNQVVSWGESTFILGGINSINPLDINAFNRPGAEVKDALMPVPMAYANIGLTDNLSLETFYQFEFQQTVLPGCGTYFSLNDFVPEGCNTVTLADGDASMARHEDGIREARDEGQFGLSLRFVSEALPDTEFGLYYMNIHSRTPLVSATKTPYSQAELQAIGNAAGTEFIIANAANPFSPTQQELAMAEEVGTQTATGTALSTSYYFTSYPEDIQLVGLSFASNVAGVALSGEVNYKKDLPLQINGLQLNTANLIGSTASLAPLGMSSTILDNEVAAVATGGEIQGYRLFDVSQAQLSGIHFFDRFLGADRYTLVAEVGYTYIHNFDEGDNTIKFGRADYYDSTETQGGFVTQSAWGYRTMLSGDYTNAFMGINLTPALVWNHDVKGVAPKTASGFNDGQKSMDISLAADYLSTYKASISYTRYFGGDYSTVDDRDYASISMGMQF